uniref:Uncharacterized protein n=2 Tax=Lotharella globosa TaxID=91324 RepID=A0A7S3ZDZ4_9EUKA|mmetsp:Transcript_233/g.344  ORF Transcript_233/g.344 Transcript_233/m.344 type:complete len:800 (+) Transcript_233:94-2493(+)
MNGLDAISDAERDKVRSVWEFAAVCQFFNVYWNVFSDADSKRDRCREFTATELEYAILRPFHTELLKEIITTLLNGGDSGRNRGYELWHENLIIELKELWPSVPESNGEDHLLCTDTTTHFNNLGPKEKIAIMYWLCTRMAEDDDYQQKLRESSLDSDDLRANCLGEDGRGNKYFSLFNEFWVFREEAKIKKKKKRGRGRPPLNPQPSDDDDEEGNCSVGWTVVCTTEEELETFTKTLEKEATTAPKKRGRKHKNTQSKKSNKGADALSERQKQSQRELVEEIREELVPKILPFEKERKRRRFLRLAPRKRSSRLARKEEEEARRARLEEERAEAKREAEARAEARRREKAREDRLKAREQAAKAEAAAVEKTRRERIERAQSRKRRLEESKRREALAIQRAKEASEREARLKEQRAKRKENQARLAARAKAQAEAAALAAARRAARPAAARRARPVIQYAAMHNGSYGTHPKSSQQPMLPQHLRAKFVENAPMQSQLQQQLHRWQQQAPMQQHRGQRSSSSSSSLPSNVNKLNVSSPQNQMQQCPSGRSSNQPPNTIGQTAFSHPEQHQSTQGPHGTKASSSSFQVMDQPAQTTEISALRERDNFPPLVTQRFVNNYNHQPHRIQQQELQQPNPTILKPLNQESQQQTQQLMQQQMQRRLQEQQEQQQKIMVAQQQQREFLDAQRLFLQHQQSLVQHSGQRQHHHQQQQRPFLTQDSHQDILSTNLNPTHHSSANLTLARSAPHNVTAQHAECASGNPTVTMVSQQAATALRIHSTNEQRMHRNQHLGSEGRHTFSVS